MYNEQILMKGSEVHTTNDALEQRYVAPSSGCKLQLTMRSIINVRR